MVGVSSTPMTPHGSGPSPYRLPETTQDTPRITFLVANPTRDISAGPTGSGTNEYRSNEVVDIVDKSTGLVIRLNGAEPDTTLSVLRTLLEHRHNTSDTPVTWDGETWS